MEALPWEEVNIPNEELSEGDLEKAEAMGKLPAMKFRAACRSSYPQEVKADAYTCYGANLKWEVLDLYKIEEIGKSSKGKTVYRNPTDTEKDTYEGRFVFDTVRLPHSKEKEGMKNRRLLIAKRCGLIKGDARAIPADAWRYGIIDKEVIITTERNYWVDEKTKEEKNNVKVAFDGYEAVNGGASASTPPAGALPDDI